ncbi:FAD:protein FMN transferase [Gemmobacter denitrificans]|uniref:FAD:protein FMN transferase n=1 Tax=Gemmobacter denitrificans TaxID=3123040 RepID=A0ABU8BVQ9_9RHOB
MMNRRRFMAITAAVLAGPARATETVWTGTGFGASLGVRLVGATTAQSAHALRRVKAELSRLDAIFSLHRDSALTRLNRDGRLAHPQDDLLQVLRLSADVHRATGGAFDPTVQPLYLARASGCDVAAASAAIGFGRVQVSASEIRLDREQALTLNGIAQGWAADRIATILRGEGFDRALIDTGEIATLGGHPDGRAWIAAITDPEGRRVDIAALTDRALSTSSPMGTMIGAGHPHILGPQGETARWTTVSVSAPQAALADALSTALCLLDREGIDRSLAHFPDARLEVACRNSVLNG